MTMEQKNRDTSESQLQNMQKENELLLTQVHQLEEELEHYFKRNRELEKERSSKSGDGELGICWVDDALPEALAENQRLHALVEELRKKNLFETHNALNVKLGNILIQAAESPGGLVAVPAKVGKIWRESSRKNPPKALGGKGFDKVIAAYSDGGFKAVEKIFAGVSIAPAMQANGYTALARHVMKSDRAGAAEAARYAYEIDPQPFRLKWLAFRLHEAGDVIEAEAMLDTLPKGITFSESESRQAIQLRNEGKHVRQHEAKQKTRFSERRAEVERKLKSLSDERDELSKKVTDLKGQLDQLNKAKVESNKEVKVLEQAQAKSAKDIESLKESNSRYNKENELLLEQVLQVQEKLESQYLQCQIREQEKKELAEEKEKESKLAHERQEEIEDLKQLMPKLEDEKIAIMAAKAEQEKQAAERLKKINELHQQIQEKDTSNAELSLRQQMMQEEMVRTEAQLDLIKDMLLNEPGI